MSRWLQSSFRTCWRCGKEYRRRGFYSHDKYCLQRAILRQTFNVTISADLPLARDMSFTARSAWRRANMQADYTRRFLNATNKFRTWYRLRFISGGGDGRD